MKNRYSLSLIILMLFAQPYTHTSYATACKVLAGTLATAASAHIISGSLEEEAPETVKNFYYEQAGKTDFNIKKADSSLLKTSPNTLYVNEDLIEYIEWKYKNLDLCKGEVDHDLAAFNSRGRNMAEFIAGQTVAATSVAPLAAVNKYATKFPKYAAPIFAVGYGLGLPLVPTAVFVITNTISNMQDERAYQEVRNDVNVLTTMKNYFIEEHNKMDKFAQAIDGSSYERRIKAFETRIEELTRNSH